LPILRCTINIMQGLQVERVRFGVYEADLRAGELRKHGIRIHLQRQPFKVLAALIERPGESVTREDLRKKIWGPEVVVDFDHSLGTAINKLREALCDSADTPQYIETLSRRGFRFIAPVEAIAPAPAAAPFAGHETHATAPPIVEPVAGQEIRVTEARVPEARPVEVPARRRRFDSWALGISATAALVFAALWLTQTGKPPAVVKFHQI